MDEVEITKVAKLKNGKAICMCDTDHFVYSSCDVCGAEVEKCLDCGLIKASDCEHYDRSQGFAKD